MALCEICVNTGPYGGWKFKNATNPTVFIRWQPSFMRTLATIVEYRILLCTLWRKWTLRDRRVVTIFINGKPYMETFDLQLIWKSKSKSLRFRNCISYNAEELGHMLLLNINRKVYIGSQLMQLHLTFVPFKVYVKVTLILNAYISLRSWVRP